MLISYPSELGRLERSDLGPEVKSRIKEFLSYLQVWEELSEELLYFYSVKLRKIAGMMGEAFLDPSDK